MWAAKAEEDSGAAEPATDEHTWNFNQKKFN